MQSETHPAGMTPADVLSEHHRVLDEQLDSLMVRIRLDPPDLRAVWTTFETELLRHLDYEEATILPGFARQHPREAQAIRVEHGRLRAALLDLGVSLDLHTLREEAVNAFVGQLREHAQREEALLYPWARRNAAAGRGQPAKHGFLQLGARLM